MTTTTATLFGLVVFGGLLFLRWRQVRLYPIGVGVSADSPDRKLRAYVTTFDDKTFFGRRSSFYRLEVEDLTAGVVVGRFESDRFPASDAEGVTSICRVLWTTDSDLVRFVSGQRELWKKELKKTAEPGATDNPDDA